MAPSKQREARRDVETVEVGEELSAPEIPDTSPIPAENASTYTVRLAVPTQASGPEEAVEQVMRDLSDYGTRQWLWLATHEDTGQQWFVGENGLLSESEVDALIAEGDDDVDSDEDDEDA